MKGYRVKQFPRNDRKRDFSRLFDVLGVAGKYNYYRIPLFLDIPSLRKFSLRTKKII